MDIVDSHQLVPMTTLPEQVEDVRTGVSVEALKRALADNLFYLQGKTLLTATPHDYYLALAYTVRDRLLQHMMSTLDLLIIKPARTVCYLSAEFLMGPHLGNNLLNMGLWEQVEQAVTESGLDLAELLALEEEPGLGNGGLGRLAACFLDSLATRRIPAVGYGIRYEYGIFDQAICKGWQVEISDLWLRYGNPWELARPEDAVEVKLGGHTAAYTDAVGHYRVKWEPNQVVVGIPYDTPVLGYRNENTCILRLWKAEAHHSFDFGAFNTGDYFGAVHEKIRSETISKVLYPNDVPVEGRQLRLSQQYFFVSCSLQDMIRRVLASGLPLHLFHERMTVQLNDTHPAIAIAELMRLLVDEHGMDWDMAWSITQQTFAYTNHTLMPEALERWSLSLFASLLPRPLEIIYEINQRFLDEVRRRYPQDEARVARLSLIEEGQEKRVRMAHLACVGSHHINGVAALHSELLRKVVLRDFYELWPEKFTNVTNGVTPRRWIALSNPRLSQLLDEYIGDDWLRDLEQLRNLEPLAGDPEFRRRWQQIKRANKADLAVYIQKIYGIEVNPDSLFDIQVKRIHEYKRQHLNVLHIIALYNRLRQNPKLDVAPRTFIFGGKAAPGYHMAKLIIKLINSVAETVNRDPIVQDRLKVVFLPDFNVTLGQRVYPSADLSEQISTAGMEASGTGNMKFSMNGALTIGTLDGANIEIREQVGAENFFLFGLSAAEVTDLKAKGYNPWNYYESNLELKVVLEQLTSGYFCPDEPQLFKPLVDSLLGSDPFLVLADFAAYVDSQQQVDRAWLEEERWVRMSILNVARMDKFSSDRSIDEYAHQIWQVEPIATPPRKQYVQINAGRPTFGQAQQPSESTD